MRERISRPSGAIGIAVNRCAGCPYAGLCTPCKPGIVEFGKNVLSVQNLSEIPANYKGRVTFNAVSQRSGESSIIPIRTSEKTCSECHEPASSCPHSKSRTNDLIAA